MEMWYAITASVLFMKKKRRRRRSTFFSLRETGKSFSGGGRRSGRDTRAAPSLLPLSFHSEAGAGIGNRRLLAAAAASATVDAIISRRPRAEASEKAASSGGGGGGGGKESGENIAARSLSQSGGLLEFLLLLLRIGGLGKWPPPPPPPHSPSRLSERHQRDSLSGPKVLRRKSNGTMSRGRRRPRKKQLAQFPRKNRERVENPFKPLLPPPLLLLLRCGRPWRVLLLLRVRNSRGRPRRAEAAAASVRGCCRCHIFRCQKLACLETVRLCGGGERRRDGNWKSHRVSQ